MSVDSFCMVEYPRLVCQKDKLLTTCKAVGRHDGQRSYQNIPFEDLVKLKDR